MKKQLCFFITILFLLGMTACSSEKAPGGGDSSDTGAPALIGMAYEDVMNTPAYAETYTIEKSEQYSDTAEKGIITDQSPRPGQSMRSDVIRIVVSKGPRYATTTTAQAIRKKVPRVTDEVVEDAIRELTEKGFKAEAGNTVYINNETYERGVVLSQEPAAGTYELTGTEVVLTVSSGYVDASIDVSFPRSEKTIDLQVFVDGKKQTEKDLNVPLTDLLVMDLQSFSFTTTLQKSTYTVEVKAALSGSSQFKSYAAFTVNGLTGEVRQTASHTLP